MTPTAAERAVVKKGLEQLQAVQLRWLIDGPQARRSPDGWWAQLIHLTAPLRFRLLVTHEGDQHYVREAARTLGREGVLSVVREILAERGAL